MFTSHSRTYYRFLCSYLCLLLTGAFVIGAIWQAFAAVSLRRSAVETQHEILRQSVVEIDNDLQILQSADYQLTSSNELFISVFHQEDSPLRDLRIVQTLKQAIVASNFINEIVLYDPGTAFVYTSSGCYSAEIFFSSIYPFGQGASLSDISTAKRRYICTASAANMPDRYVVFVNTPTLYSRLNNSVVVFYIRESWLRDKLTSAASGREGAVVASDGTLVYSSCDITGEVLSQPGERQTINGSRYLKLSSQSPVTGWTYYLLIPYSRVFDSIYTASAFTYGIIALLVISGTVLIKYFMRMNYTPLKELTLEMGIGEGEDDIESLRDTLGTLSAQNEDMRKKLTDSTDGQTLKDALLFSLLKGKFSSFEAYNNEGRALGVGFTKPAYQVLMIHLFSDESPLPARRTIEEAFSNELKGDFSLSMRELFESSTFVCLAGMEEGSQKLLEEKVKKVLASLAEEKGLLLTIGSSCCYTDISHITAACYEASRAANEYFGRGRQQYIPYSGIDISFPARDENIESLSRLPGMNDEEKKQAVKALFASLKERQVNSFVFKYCCIYCLQQLMASLPESSNLTDVFAINYLKTADDYLAYMLRLIDDNSTSAHEPAASPDDDEMIAKIKAYIAENYDDSNFSIQSSADMLGMSTTYISKYFHKQTGDTLNNYVSNLRMQKACSLLLSTEMPVQLVAETVGYYNVNSFIRRFKQMTGVTPSDYRKRGEAQG